MVSELANRRKFLEDVLALGATLALSNGLTSSLEALAQTERKIIGTFSDNNRNLRVIERYSDGVFLVQNLNQTDEYSAEILYFVRNGPSREFGGWSVRCDLYKKGSPVPVNTITVDGSLEGRKFAVTKTTGPDKQNIFEQTLIQGAYEQSAVFDLSRKNEGDIETYLNYFAYRLNEAIKNRQLTPMPSGYNPLQAK